MKEKTNFSIVMPLYNSKSTLEKAIKSILNQSYKNYELIIVDDSSTDGSYEIVKKLATENKKITLYRMEKNKGAPYCMNFATKKAKYEWVGIVDSDAIETENWLKNASKYVDRKNEIFGGKVTYLTDQSQNGYFVSVFFYLENFLFPEKKVIYNVNNIIEPTICGANFFYTKKVFKKIGGFDPNIKVGYDRLFISLAVEGGFDVLYLPELFVYHPLYNYKNIKSFLKRTVFFTRWKIPAMKKSKVIEKPYRLASCLFLISSICLLFFYLLFGFKITIMFTLPIFLVTIIIYSIRLYLKYKIPLKYIPGYIFLNITKKSIGLAIYLLNIKPYQSDWKDR